ncbi:MAG: hypothetical protein ACK4OP_00415 [Gemmobacter sp.]
MTQDDGKRASRPTILLPPDRCAIRAAAAAARLQAVRSLGSVPEACGPDIVPAPARGPVRLVTPYVQVGNARINDGWRGPGEAVPRAALARADIWDLMLREAAARHARAGGDTPFDPPFTPSQIAMARHYRDLVERHDAGGMRCSSVEAQACRGGAGGFADAFLAEGRAIAAIRARIGDGAALVLRRIRPSARGTRSVISDRALVDGVALGDMAVGAVLARHGWALSAAVREAARAALAAALDRMQGHVRR